MNPSNPTEQELYTMHALAEQANNAQANPVQVLQHLQSNMVALQAQVETMQNSIQAQVNNLTNNNAPLMSIQSAIESISVQCRETMQANHTVLNGMRSVLNGMRSVLDGLAQRPSAAGPSRPRVSRSGLAGKWRM
ncbi:hypothetical protein BC939DRAFT_477491 [Gamsiella multidivaricata]|uniref:uncharacterized protein n=1 Tax=Gamsiella multidivaricata TaxID=101098 RepID=UPI00222089D6|nr:uncharacterized protein BC939DRAFT_477491 [Gamsiella multidivaricata]KAI7823069.1 hypothetical protein BC939DRAFT_477491 [Gamsiella multidivaricata]